MVLEESTTASDSIVDEALQLIDNMIENEKCDTEQELELKIEKTLVAANEGHMDVAIATALEVIEINRARNDKLSLEENYAFLGQLYEIAGDGAKALEAYRVAKGLADETGNQIS